MVGALFIYPMFQAARQGLKTETRRFGDKPAWKIGQRLYVKEPVILMGEVGQNPKAKDIIWQQGELKFTRVQYLYDDQALPTDDGTFWIKKQKLFCPEKAARYMMQVTNVKRQRLGDMEHCEYRAEGLQQHFAVSLDDRSAPGKEWRVEMANDLMFSDSDPAKVYEYLLNATAGGKKVYNPDALVWAYKFMWMPYQRPVKLK
ncbi:MAG TPA: hypothetical protein PK228_19160 [Saprospiraceae bacterium]|nr:hypothetical protein [Saprospiraceae bacterium]